MSAVAAQTKGLSRFPERWSHICLRVPTSVAPDLMNDILLVPCSVRSLLLENASGAGNEETEKVADLKDEFERLERREVEVLSFA